jgi:hypothetical protein
MEQNQYEHVNFPMIPALSAFPNDEVGHGMHLHPKNGLPSNLNDSQ